MQWVASANVSGVSLQVVMMRLVIASSIMTVHSAACNNGMFTGAGGGAYVIGGGDGVGDAGLSGMSSSSRTGGVSVNVD